MSVLEQICASIRSWIAKGYPPKALRVRVGRFEMRNLQMLAGTGMEEVRFDDDGEAVIIGVPVSIDDEMQANEWSVYDAR